MPSQQKSQPLPRSERLPREGMRAVGRANSTEVIEVTIALRHRDSGQGLPSLEELGALMPHERQHLSREDFTALHGADPEDVTQIEAFAREYNLKVVETNIRHRTVTLSATIGGFNSAFGVDLQHHEHAKGNYRGYRGPIHLPENLHSIVEAVLGLDDRPIARAQLPTSVTCQGKEIPQPDSTIRYPLPQLAGLYNFPPDFDGSSQCIAIIALGGGYNEEDLKSYFNDLDIPMPSISNMLVNGGLNQPTIQTDEDLINCIEVIQDIEITGAMAPGARIVVYFAPDNDKGLANALKTAIHDIENRPSVISISWGSSEIDWRNSQPGVLDVIRKELYIAGILGITVCVSSGDDGAWTSNDHRRLGVLYPASSPYVLSCGGTTLAASDKRIQSETVWNRLNSDLPAFRLASGGGVSTIFSLPIYQIYANVPQSADSTKGRGVPDVAGNADPDTGYLIKFCGQYISGGGTSAVAPLWAALIARINQALGVPVGFINPLLYRMQGTEAFHQITSGDNGYYKATSGWSACTGLGTPDASKILDALNALRKR